MKQKGFTLIELLGVIIIISLLMLIVMPKIINSLKSSSLKVDELTLKMIYNASELYVDTYPDKFDERNGSQYCILLRDLTGEGYLKSPINVGDVDITNLKSVQVTYNNGFKFEVVDIGDCVVETDEDYADGTTGGGSLGDGTTGDENITQTISLSKDSINHNFDNGDEIDTSVEITVENVDISKIELIHDCATGIYISLVDEIIQVYAHKDNIISSTSCTVKVELPGTDVYDTFSIALTKIDGGYNPGGDSEVGTCTVTSHPGKIDVASGSGGGMIEWYYESNSDSYSDSTYVYFGYTEGSVGTCKTVEICNGAIDEMGNPYTTTVCGCNSGEGNC